MYFPHILLFSTINMFHDSCSRFTKSVDVGKSMMSYSPSPPSLYDLQADHSRLRYPSWASYSRAPLSVTSPNHFQALQFSKISCIQLVIKSSSILEPCRPRVAGLLIRSLAVIFIKGSHYHQVPLTNKNTISEIAMRLMTSRFEVRILHPV